MKNVLIGTLALSALMATASVSAHNWTGPYVGLNAGMGWNDTDYSLSPENLALFTDSGSVKGSAFIGGIELGYNWQDNDWVYGLEADFDYYGLTHNASQVFTAGTYQVHEKIDWLSTLRARLGMLVNPCTLVYLTGGVALAPNKSNAEVNYTVAPTDVFYGTNSDTKFGWTAGIGSEYAWNRNWLTKIEYLYVGFEGHNYTLTGTNVVGNYQASFGDESQNIVRVGIDYVF